VRSSHRGKSYRCLVMSLTRGCHSGTMGRRGKRTAHTVLLASAWTTATLIAGIVTWTAVARLGHEATASTQPMLSQSQVRRELSQSLSSTTPPPDGPPGNSPRTSPSGPSRQPTSPSQHIPRHSRSWNVSGGQVGASCRGSAIRIDYASPADGWGMGIIDSGPSQVLVEFSRGASDVKVEATCTGGVPLQSSAERDD
jgi:hypothetical protein